MKRFRLLILALLTLAATPLFAFGCGYCSGAGCVMYPGTGNMCVQEIDWCWEYSEPWCYEDPNAAVTSSLSSELAIASVEIVTPDGSTKTAEPLQTAELRADDRTRQ